MWELQQKIEELLEEYMKSSGAVKVSAEDVGLDIRCGFVWISTDENWIAVEGSTRNIDHYGGFEYIDEQAKKTIDLYAPIQYTFYEGEDGRVEDCLEFYRSHND